jgi:hypothetical protein
VASVEDGAVAGAHHEHVEIDQLMTPALGQAG